MCALRLSGQRRRRRQTNNQLRGLMTRNANSNRAYRERWWGLLSYRWSVLVANGLPSTVSIQIINARGHRGDSRSEHITIGWCCARWLARRWSVSATWCDLKRIPFRAFTASAPQLLALITAVHLWWVVTYFSQKEHCARGNQVLQSVFNKQPPRIYLV